MAERSMFRQIQRCPTRSTVRFPTGSTSCRRPAGHAGGPRGGLPTIWLRLTRHCGSRCWRRGSQDSGPRVATAAGLAGLAEAVERRGVTIYEDTPVTEIASGRAVTTRGTVRAPIILRATEGFTPRQPGLCRTWLPMNSSMIATDPIPAALRDEIGWEGRETVGDSAHGFFYAQRTVDDRIAIGCSPTCSTRSCRRCGTCRSLMAGAACSL